MAAKFDWKFIDLERTREFHVVLQIHEFRSKFVCAKSIDAKVCGCTKNLTKLKKKTIIRVWLP